MGEKSNDLTEIITQAINEIKIELGEKFNPDMKSVVTRRDSDGHPIWQKDYELFMGRNGWYLYQTRGLSYPLSYLAEGRTEIYWRMGTKT